MPTPPESARSAAPAVAVLLATHNGLRWLPEQMSSILDQDGVAVRVIVSDDGSTDGTREWLEELAATETRLTILPTLEPTGSAAANFYRLIEHAELEADELVAFADQDDLWLPGKLQRHAALIADEALDAVSSNVTAVLANGKRVLLAKSFPQRRFDYLLESPGPGSTFLLSPTVIELTRRVLADPTSRAREVDYHDWLIYAVARAAGLRWRIDPVATVDYRQHDANTMGANIGVSSATSRLGLMRRRWHRNQAILIAQICLTVASGQNIAGLRRMLELLTQSGVGARLALARRVGDLRRRTRDQGIIAVLITIGAW